MRLANLRLGPKKRQLHLETHLGHRFGTRVVASAGAVPAGATGSWWLMRCDCGDETSVNASILLRGRAMACQKCTRAVAQGPASGNWRGFGVVPSTAYNHFRWSAVKRGIPWEITMEDVDALFHAQGGRCAVTGRELIFRRGNRWTGRHLASLDRIENSLGYMKGNIQLVTGDVNMAKQMLSMEDFIALCRDVVRVADE